MPSNRILRAPHPTASAQRASIAPQPLRGALDMHHVYQLTQQLPVGSRSGRALNVQSKARGTSCRTKPSLLRIQPRRSLISLTTANKSIRS